MTENGSSPARALVIRWEEPPPEAPREKNAKGPPTLRIAGYLQAHPGKWGLVWEGDGSSNTYAWRLRKAGCEAVARLDLDTRVTRVYARWPADA